MFVTERTLKEFETLMQTVTILALGYTQDDIDLWTAYQAAIDANEDWTDPVPVNPYYFVRLSYPSLGAPAWKKDESVVFLRVVETPNQYNEQRETQETFQASPEGFLQKMSFTRIYQVFWSCWGEDGFINSEKIRDFIFIDDIYFRIVREKIFPVLPIKTSRRAPELFGGSWWERTDVDILFYELVEKEREIEVLKSAEIIVENKDGQVAAIDVTE
jgi:hypothetical protein